MKRRPEQAKIPAPADETARRRIVSLLRGRELSALQISSEIRISEREVYHHLDHIRRSMEKTDLHLAVIPAECKKCGFVFSKRDRLTKPGKCPICRGEAVHEPRFALTEGR